MKTIFFGFLIFIGLFSFGAGEKTMKLTSQAFENEGMIPSLYTCDGKDIPPVLMWDSVPDGTKSLALICDDPDAPAGTWVHWVIYNINPEIKELSEKTLMQSGAVEGINDFKKVGYGGPCPPSGIHRYFFKLYALDKKLDINPGINKSKLEELMKGHIILKTELIGKYKRL